MLTYSQHDANAVETAFANDQKPTSAIVWPGQSAAQVFATTELLEQILISVGEVRSLMTMRRVAHKWQDVIDGTESLKRMMWLAPQQLDHEWYRQPGGRWFHKRPTNTVAAPGDIVYKAARNNPFLFDRGSNRPIWKSSYHVKWISQRLRVRHQPKLFSQRARSLFLKMFATQPPVTVLFLRTRAEQAGKKSFSLLVERIKNTKGVEVGDILRVADRMPDGEKTVVAEEVMFPSENARVVKAKAKRGFDAYR